MNDPDRWQEGNDTYLAAALDWLRLRLTRQARPPDEAAPAAPERLAGGRLFGRKPSPPTAVEQANRASESRAAAILADAEDMKPPPALVILSQRFGLSRFEQEVLLLCAAMELDTRVAGLCARAQDDPARAYPTFALALALFDDPAWDALSPERPLRYWRLIEINQPGAQPLTTSALRADERIVNYLKGLNYLDDRLGPLLVPFDASAGAALPPSQQKAVEMSLGYLRTTTNGGQPPVIQLIGLDTVSKQLVAQRAAADIGLHLNRLPVGLLPTQPAELETLARLWQRESVLLPVALYLDAQEADGPNQPEGQTPPVGRFLARGQGVFFLATREIRPGLGPITAAVEVDKPTSSEQGAAWTAALDGAAASSPDRLAGQFNLNVAAIRSIAKAAGSNGQLTPESLWQACLVATRPRMDTLAQRLDPKATWDDIVLPEEELKLLRRIAAQVGQRAVVYDEWGFREKMNRGLGISALFAGPSGTGKTMAAEVIANELHLNLYRIDLSAVVSKYIGETEKNLRRLFDAAEDGGAILFFDEADALFGKRSEVKDSHDRYANIEINYLLQRMEAYRGLAILATNMKTALDHAFLRRLRFIINFPFPGPAERKLIWEKVFPPETPVSGLNYDRLARLNLAGGGIHNCALNAAFLAANRGVRVTMPLILTAARAEFRKLEQPINEADFRWSEPVADGG